MSSMRFKFNIHLDNSKPSFRIHMCIRLNQAPSFPHDSLFANLCCFNFSYFKEIRTVIATDFEDVDVLYDFKI